MPLNLQKNLPAVELLKKEHIFVMDSLRASEQDIRPLRVAVLNLMPLKITTETDLVRLLSNTPLQVELDFMKIKGHTPKNTPIEHMQEFYKDFDEMQDDFYDGMIITGAPVEQMPFEEVNYWEEVTEIFDWARTHVTSTLYICWAAQAGLYHFYGVPKYDLPAKMFGVFEHRVIRPSNPLVRGFDEVFYAPHSRWAGLDRAAIDACGDLRILAESDVAGPMLLSTESGRQIFVIGHPEYDKYTLDKEYKRDVAAGKPINIPCNYYPDDDPSRDPLFRWRAHGYLLYTNWMNYYVYQDTPYDLNRLEALEK